MARRRRVSLYTPTRDTQAAGGDAEAAPPRIRTSPTVIVIACLVGALGAWLFGFFAFVLASLAQFNDIDVLAAGILRGLFGAAIGASFVGLCVLICGGRIGRLFSYPFVLALTSLLIRLIPLVKPSRESFIVFIWVILFTQIILTAVIGRVLARYISGYTGQSRRWAAVGAVSMLVIGYLLLLRLSVFMALLLGFWMFQPIWFAVYGGSAGAIVGAIRAKRRLAAQAKNE